ncbi:MAG: hydroxyacylglutathione hydrolase [Gammaproteobacteria bacterium RIFCSPHIGHO2_12_FULL_40_19]|nr:MAG: hydroxyacylglutathione hydrolase [Gammaproteobacteria bacterium RIFCSPHIGHO2_12_FULL_40_19]
MLHIKPISAFHDNYIWMISHPESSRVIIVDPGEAKGVLEILKERHYSLAGILITHHHHDHTAGIKALIKEYPAPVYGPARDAVPLCDQPLTESDEVAFPDLKLSLQVLDIPGHTAGHIAFVGEGLLFSGDTLFTAGCGRLFEGTAGQMVHSLAKLAQLPNETLVYCGHEYTANNLRFAALVEPENTAIQERIHEVDLKRAQGLPTVPASLAIEKQTNPFLRCHVPAVIRAAEEHCRKSLEGDLTAVFSVIREWKNQY